MRRDQILPRTIKLGAIDGALIVPARLCAVLVRIYGPDEGGEPLQYFFPTALFAPLFRRRKSGVKQPSAAAALRSPRRDFVSIVSARVGFPQRAMEKGVGLAISPLADTPIRARFPEMGDDPFCF
jgi:hypothetical protein